MESPPPGTLAKGDARRERGSEGRHRAVAVRGNYLGQDRMDMQYAAKEISRFTSKPEEQDWKAAKSLARSLKHHRMVMLEHKYKELPSKVVVWWDADFAGCGRTRRSASGGVVMLGSRCLKTHSQTQETIGLCSGESEFYGIAKAATMGIGIKSMLKGLGLKVEV